MSVSCNRLDGSDDDEFDSVFDDQQFLDPELEQSLAQAEATYTASQAVQPSAIPSTSYFAAQPSHSSFRPHADSAARSGIRRGIFIPPVAKRQRLDPGPSNLSRAAAPSKSSLQHEPGLDQVIVRDLRDQEFADQDDDKWWTTNNALDQVEEEAIRMSQQIPTSQPLTSAQNNNNHNIAQTAQNRALIGAAQSSIATSKKPPDLRRSPGADTNSANQDSIDNDELAQLRAEVERLRSAQKAQDEMLNKLKQEAYRKSGEVAVVRQNLTKLNQENSKLREREVVREQEHRAALDRLQKDQERRLQRLETETAFRRVEQDTSRRIWPSSVARLPPVGLRDVDRRQESQVRAGLTTPTKANRFGARGGSGSSGTRQRYADTTAHRHEPGTPTRSAVKPAPVFPRPPTAAASASKTKAFRGLQNSFADFGPVQEKIRQQRQLSANGSRQSALAPAEWDADQSMATGHADQDDVVMADDHQQPVSPPKTTAMGHRSGIHEDPDTVHTIRKEHDYLAAVSEILSRRTTIVSLLLSHSSPKAAPPASYPTNRFNPTGSHPHINISDIANDDSFSSSSTLSRLISANLVPNCPNLLLYRYRKAVESLLTNLSRAKVLELEEREDAFRLLSTEGTDQSIEELDFSSATMHLSHAIASSLTTMAGVLLRLCQTDLLADVLRLVSCLISTLPRFWLDLECLETDLEARADEFAFLGPDAATATAQWARYPTPTLLREILAQCIDDCWLPSASRGTSASTAAAVGNESDAVNIRGTQKRGEDTDRLGFGDWTMPSEAREDLLHAVVQVLEAMSQCPDASPSSSHHPLRLLARPGVLHQLLHPDRSSFIIFTVVRMLSSGVSNAPLIHECLASKADSQGTGRGASHSMGPRANARFPVLELLVKHLVDRRLDLPESEWHPLHCGILTFLTQAALRSADTLIVLADSAALLAALIRCLSLDSDFIWLQSRPTFMLPARLPTYRKGFAKAPDSTTIPDPSGANLVQATERIVMDTRLLNLLYNYPLPLSSNSLHRFEPASTSVAHERMGSISLATKLDQPETYSMLNGIRQSFIVALSRIAFCSEPDWMAEERRFLASLLDELRKQKRKIGADGGGDCGDQLEEDEDERVTVREEVERGIGELDRVSMLLEAIADVAGDLADLVLSPEEVDSVYDLLAEEDVDGDEEEEAMDVDPEELGRRQREVPSSQPQEEDGRGEGSETESEPELETRRDEVQQKKPASRAVSRSVSKSVSPKKGGRGMAVEENEEEDTMIDVIEIDDSD
ncbi:uncharacterized protein UTRI_02701_B [Ustilago trichophora]|uniref:Uncharacterized protein n=1 Tax=Ustilago trichophora TaxID=86804 RepID=A0A5C3E518_9BASI|nr:uncharacterized protein UTRI_02701_B [Ustilago trichophora]